MSHRLLRDARTYGVLFRIDEEFAAATRAAGCPCGGHLHSARYPRKPRGGPADRPGEYSKRLSFCCELEGCRRRSTPPSVRFLGRRVYFGMVVVLLCALAQGATSKRVARLRQLAGDVSARTVERWRGWWREAFPATPLFRELRGRLQPPVAIEDLPRSLLDRSTAAEPCDRVVATLRLLSPITTSPASLAAHPS